MELIEKNEVDGFLNAYLSPLMDDISRRKSLYRRFKEWAEVAGLYEEVEEFAERGRKVLKGPRPESGRLSVLRWMVDTADIALRDCRTLHPRPMRLVETERTNRKVLMQRARQNPLDLAVAEGYQVQLGELGYEYGPLVYRLEDYVRRGDVKPAMFTVDGYEREFFAVQATWNDFAQGFHGEDRRRVLEALRSNKFATVKIYQETDEGTIWADEYFIFARAAGFRVGKNIHNLKQGDNPVYLPIESMKSGDIPEYIEVAVNKKLYGAIYEKFGKGKRLPKNTTGYLATVPNLPGELKEAIQILNQYTGAKLNPGPGGPEVREISVKRYEDGLRIFAERIIEHYQRGMKNRRKDYMDIPTRELMMIALPGYMKRRETYDRLLDYATVSVFALGKYEIPLSGPEYVKGHDFIRFHIV